MAEYIEREALIEHIKDLPTWDYVAKADGVYEKSTKYPEGMFNCDDVINSIQNIPAADAVEVVRCKDCVFCKYNEDADVHKCDRRGNFTEYVNPDEDYCSRGKNKTIK